MLQNQQPRKLQLTEAGRNSMRAAGRFNAQVMDYIRDFVKAGVTTAELDRLVHEYTIKHGNTPATLGYMAITRSCCTSINDVICHGAG
ncbi:MAG: M24 family metallopeptidase [Pirellulales bacterium]